MHSTVFAGAAVKLPNLLELGIHDLVKLCGIVYQSDVHANTDAYSLGFRNLHHVGNGGGHAMICEDGHRVVVVIRGTELHDIWDLVSAGRVLPRKSTYGGWVHRGYEAYAKSIWHDLPEDVADTRKQLWFVGHSLGGAAAAHLALMAGEERADEHYGRPSLLTVGAPPVGTGGFCRAVRRNTASVYRIVNHRDPVPLCVPGYKHPRGLMLHFDRMGYARINPSLKSRFHDRARGWMKAAWVGLREWSVVAGVEEILPFRNHYIARYGMLMQMAVERIRKLSAA